MDAIQLNLEQLASLAADLNTIAAALSDTGTVMSNTGAATGDDKLGEACNNVADSWPKTRAGILTEVQSVQKLLVTIKANFEEIDGMLKGTLPS